MEEQTQTIKGFGLELANKYHLQNILQICEQILALEQVQPYTAADLATGFNLIAEAQEQEFEKQTKELEDTQEVTKIKKK